MAKNTQEEKIPERSIRLESEDDEVFKKAYSELRDSCKYAEENFNGLPFHINLKQELKKYTPRFKQLASNTR